MDRGAVDAALSAQADEKLHKLSIAEHGSLLKVLRQLSISSEHEAKLVRLELVERKLGGLALTDIGKLAAGNVRD